MLQKGKNSSTQTHNQQGRTQMLQKGNNSLWPRYSVTAQHVMVHNVATVILAKSTRYITLFKAN
jgi:hypothetical protein